MTDILTSSQICTKYRVSEEQINKATRIVNGTTGEIFYQVESQTVAGQMYEVHFNQEHHCFTCSCPAGQNGTRCWHRRAACASAFEHRQNENLAYRREAEEAAAYKKLEEQRDAAQATIAGLNPGKNVRQSTPFSILK